jgi:hypothetical protein
VDNKNIGNDNGDGPIAIIRMHKILENEKELQELTYGSSKKKY